ncbi:MULTISPECIES: hypothetical protein [unclassified Thiocapsa]|uniref:hypothetical protein n=1 Tax=unclassified Thiocapsa TaxID=2641286 RepID=UPI0035B484EB
MHDNGTTAQQRVLLHWNRSISDALSHRDRRYLRFLQANIAASTATFTGPAKTRALATLARCAAASRYLGARQHGR